MDDWPTWARVTAFLGMLLALALAGSGGAWGW